MLLQTRTVRETLALSQLDLHLPLAGRRRGPKEAVVNMLAAEMMSGDALALEPEPDWRILGRVICRIARAPISKHMVRSAESGEAKR